MATRILLADDSITIQKVVELTFSEGDFEVFSVSNGRQALEKIGEWNPDIALLDVIMPEKSGYEVCHEIKQSPRHRDLPVLLLTGTFEPFDPERARGSGADGHITKPFESRTLIAKVEELLAASRPAKGEAEENAVPPSAPRTVEVSFEEETDSAVAEPAVAASPAAGGFEPARETTGTERAAARTHETPDWVAGDFGQDLPTAEEIEKGFGSEDEWKPAPETPDPLLKTGMTQAFPVGGVGLDDGEGTEITADSMSEFGRTMAIEVPSEFRTPPPAAAATAGGGAAESGPETDADRGETPWGPASAAGQPPAVAPGFAAEDGPVAGHESDPLADARPSAPADRFSETGFGRQPESEPAADRFPAAPAAPVPATAAAGAEPTGEVVLSQESIDNLARRVVEKLSDQIVREIAWEVVPDLAETLIRKRIQELEEKIGD